jgi:hypothetical protein
MDVVMDLWVPSANLTCPGFIPLYDRKLKYYMQVVAAETPPTGPCHGQGSPLGAAVQALSLDELGDSDTQYIGNSHNPWESIANKQYRN